MSFYQNFKRKVIGKNGSSALEDLKSDGQFVTLAVGDAIQKNSGETWIKIDGYKVDGVVMKYNNKVEVFPSNIVAGMFGFKTSAYFNATEEERENVKVKF